MPSGVFRALVCVFSALSLGACSSGDVATLAARFPDAHVLLPGAGFRYVDARHCFIKSADWGTYCLHVAGEQEIPTPGGRMKLFQLDGVPLIAMEPDAAKPLPRAIALVGFKEIGPHRWRLQNQDVRLHTITAPARNGVPQFTDFGGGHYGFIQRLFFVDSRNIYREKALISYLDERKSHYLSVATALNDAHANGFKGTLCERGNARYHEDYCRRKITVVGSTIGFRPSAVMRDGFRAITVDCRGTHLGRPINCAYDLVYQAKRKRYAVDRSVAVFGDPLGD